MAAYAALVSLMNTIHHIQNHPRYSFSLAANHIHSLSKNAQIFLQFVESFNASHQRSKQVEDLEIQIASVACLAEYVLTSLTGDLNSVDRTRTSFNSTTNLHKVVPQMKQKASKGPEKVFDPLLLKVKAMKQKEAVEVPEKVFDPLLLKMKAMKQKEAVEVPEKVQSIFDADHCNSFDLEKLIDHMNSIVEEVMKIKTESATKGQRSTDSMASASTRSPTTGTNSMVGFDGYLLQLMDALTGDLSTRHIISVLGMGGIGKTTLAKNVYDDSLIEHHFDVRAWVTISQDYDTKDILLQLLDRKGESTKDTSEDLGEKLYKKLWGRMYLIVLDDMWSTDVWDRIRFFFPDNDNRSRVVITTRITNVSSHLSSSPLEMHLLDDDESWKLFCATAFREEECPVDLVEIGKNIVKKCKGLPLSIVVIGGHLKKTSRMKEEWETVARNMMSVLDSGEDQCLSILSLSYTHLPACLKPCFLYMGGYPEDKIIYVTELIRFWVAEGFLQPDGARCFEEIAESYLKDLVDRNLILVQEQGWNGKIYACKVHDLVREVCLKVGRKERFFCVLKHGGGSSRCKHEESFGGSVICSAAEKDWQVDETRLVFDQRYLEEFFDRSLHSRYIYLPNWCYIQPYLPSTISLCWNLQTLTICMEGERLVAPDEIWEMAWLRHLDIQDSICLPDPPKKHLVMPSLLVAENLTPSEDVPRRIPYLKELELYYNCILHGPKRGLVMRSLQTLKVVENLKLSVDVCERIPNIKYLHIYYDFDLEESNMFFPNNLACLQKLESLRLEFSLKFNYRNFARDLTYPSMLQELWLKNSGLHWEDLRMIGMLPDLQVFTVDSVEGEEWSPATDQFGSLRSLTIDSCKNLVHWNAESSMFPVLETLILREARKLMEFPGDIGEIPTLRRVELDRCSVDAAISAIRVLVEQQELENEDLGLQIKLWDGKDQERVKEMMQEECIKSKNLFLNFS